MKRAGFISRAESLQIWKNELRKTAIEEQAAELAGATAADRQEMLAQIDRDIEGELRRRRGCVEPDSLIH